MIIRKRPNKLFLLVIKLLVATLFYVLVLLYKSFHFLETVFEGVDFQLALYQIRSPLKGTGNEVLRLYVDNCIIHSIIITIFILGIPFILKILFTNKKWIWKIRIVDINFKITISPLFSTLQKKLYYLILTLCFVILMINSAINVGVFSYISRVNNRGTIFEDYYVEPDSVSIVFPENKRNLLLIYLESMESTYADVSIGGGKQENYIPNLTQLAMDNNNFSNTDNSFGGFNNYGLAAWTMAALLATSSGVPYLLPVEGNSMSEYDKFLPGLNTLGDILESEGYNNYFICGSDASFGGRDIFYKNHGNYTILDYYSAQDDGIIPEGYNNNFWGMEDKYLYEYAKAKLSEISQKAEPFNFTMLTVDTHHTDGYICDLCRNEHSEQYGNAISCADRQLSSFMEWACKQEWYEDTTIVVIGDHISMNTTFWDDVDENYKRSVYNCFINVPFDTSTIKFTNRSMSQLDMFPTILSSMGVRISGERLGLGTNLFSNVPTLEEELGTDYFYNEASKYSVYYDYNFVNGN